MQVTLDFHPTVNGEINDELVISYDTGTTIDLIFNVLYAVVQARKSTCTSTVWLKISTFDWRRKLFILKTRISRWSINEPSLCRIAAINWFTSNGNNTHRNVKKNNRNYANYTRYPKKK